MAGRVRSDPIDIPRGGCIALDKATLSLFLDDTLAKILATCSLFGKVISRKVSDLGVVCGTIKRAWTNIDNVTTTDTLSTTRFALKVNNEAGKSGYGIRHCVDNIPFLYLTSENAQKLGLQAGEVLQIDEDAEEKPKWIEWLRFRVGVKASLPHFTGCYFKKQNGEKI
ncbi:hypothetical protein G4B88_017322 [Cannabis sativa]|uniref:Uncharacterized protein n=1 Tax=Cannabis sativa TaxID=3483 RepID=A0A7J6EFB2_CANSA|nr:hypothetical protein G4B88_017322 [Cannabis sativa]